MKRKNQFSVLMEPGFISKLDDYAAINGISRARAVEILCRIGLQSTSTEDRLISIENKLRQQFISLMRQGMYLCEMQTFDKKIWEKASVSGEASVKRIFDDTKDRSLG